MTDDITLRMGQEAPLMSVTGQKRSIVYLLVHETKKALLIAAVEKLEEEIKLLHNSRCGAHQVNPALLGDLE